MNSVKPWVGLAHSRGGGPGRQALQRGSFGSVTELIVIIERFTGQWNAGATPFAWVRMADEILTKAVRKPWGHVESRQ